MSNKLRDFVQYLACDFEPCRGCAGQKDDTFCKNCTEEISFSTIVTEARKVLSDNPLRNCDVGTPQEQSVRMAKFCSEQYKKTDGVALCSGCQFHDIEGLECQFAWSQMPYEAEKENTR